MRYLLSLLILCFAGCAATPVVDPPAGNEIADSISDINKELTQPGKEMAQKALWPFMLAAFICLLGGAAAVWFLKDWKLLGVGVILGLIPYLFSLYAPMFALPFMILGCLLMVCIGVYAVYKTWDIIEDDIRSEKELK